MSKTMKKKKNAKPSPAKQSASNAKLSKPDPVKEEMSKDEMLQDVQFFDEAHEVEEVRPVRVSLHLICKRHLPADSARWEHDKIITELNKITHLRLDRESISEINGLELLGDKVRNIYLQMNRIEKIENLDTLPHVRFITLADNKISHIEGLTHMANLGFLDLSNNSIEKVDVDELPQSLVILNLEGNPCTKLPDYRGRIIQELHKLRQLDGVEVTKEERIEAGYTVSDSEEEEEEEDAEDTTEQENLAELTTKILIRSQDRMEESHMEHQQKMLLLAQMKRHTQEVL